MLDLSICKQKVKVFTTREQPHFRFENANPGSRDRTRKHEVTSVYRIWEIQSWKEQSGEMKGLLEPVRWKVCKWPWNRQTVSLSCVCQNKPRVKRKMISLFVLYKKKEESFIIKKLVHIMVPINLTIERNSFLFLQNSESRHNIMLHFSSQICRLLNLTYKYLWQILIKCSNSLNAQAPNCKRYYDCPVVVIYR